MPVIQMDEKEILYKSRSPQRVSDNGTVSVERKNRGKMVILYVVEVDICPGCNKPVDKCTGQFRLCVNRVEIND